MLSKHISRSVSMQTLQTESTTEKVQCIAFGLGTDLAFVHPLQEGAVDSQAADEMDCSTMDQQVTSLLVSFFFLAKRLFRRPGCVGLQSSLGTMIDDCKSPSVLFLSLSLSLY